MQPIQPNYAPNVVNQTVDYGGATWKGQPGGQWTLQNVNPAATNVTSTPQKTDINPATGKSYDTNPTTGVPDDNYWATVGEPQLKAQAAGGTGSTGGTGVLGVGGKPTFDLIAATNAAYNTPEITAANKAITDANTEFTTRQQALADAQAEINDNPFYSEATRVGKSAKLTQQGNADMTVIQNKVKLAQDQLVSLKADAQIKVNAAQGQYNINRQAYQDSLTNFDNLVKMGGLDSASGSDIATLALQTGIPTSMIQSIQKLSQQKDNPQEKPQIVQATDNEGNVSILAVDPLTGKVINTTTISGAGKAATYKGQLIGDTGVSGGGTGTKVSASDKKVSETQQNTSNAAAAVKAGAQLKELVDHYGSVLSVDQIYSIYNANAKTPAKESLPSVKQGRYANVKNSGWLPAKTK